MTDLTALLECLCCLRLGGRKVKYYVVFYTRSILFLEQYRVTT